MAEIPSVFISYPHDEASGQALAREVYQRLKDEGIPAFLDEHSIRLGDRWIRTLSEGVEHCKIMLAVVSPASHDRPWVEKEYIAASEVNALIIPVIATEGNLPMQINDLQAAKLYGDNKAAQWTLLLTRIREELPDTSQETTRQAEKNYLNHLLQDNEERALGFASKVYAPLGGKLRKERKRIAVAAMSPMLLHRKRTQYDEPQDPSGECTEHDDIITAFKQHKRLVILGEPGAGKTFSLWRIAAEQAQLALDDSTQPLPVVIPLNRWDDPSLSLHDFVLQQLGKLAECFTTLYESKRLLPLFDALNEIPFDQRENKLPQVRAWLEKYPSESLLLTCRKRDYRGPLDVQIDQLTIEPLDPPRIYDFLHNYFSDGEAEHAMAEALFWQLAGGEGIRNVWKTWQEHEHKQHWEAFWTITEIPEDWPDEIKPKWRDSQRISCLNDPRSMIKLASNPYLLTQMVVIYGDQQKLPESRIELFTAFVDDLIFRETEARPENHYPKAQQEKLRNDLKGLAWQLQSRTGSLKEARTTLPRVEAEKLMSLALLEFSAAASIIDLSKDSVRFSHQLLQEFFTAQSFSEKIAGGLKATELWNPKNWWETNGWEEAAKLAVDYESDPSELLHWLAGGNPRLAAEFAREQSLLEHKDDLFQAYKSRWQSVITDVKAYPHPHERHAISTVLAWLDWDDRMGIGVNDAQLPDIDWVEISEGEFIYGEKDKQQRLSIGTFSISRFPVTNRQFQAFVKAGGYENDQWWEGLKKPELPSHSWIEANRPVESIDWYESNAFCRWLSAETCEDIRLPTEQQWEKAARGAEGNEYPWGDEYISGYANTSSEEPTLDETSAVGIYPQGKSLHEVLDMSGNVFEWCLNKYEKADDITTDLSNDSRVVRGGSWICSTGHCRSSFRYDRRPDSRNYNLGFRLVRLVSPITDH